MNYRFSIAVFSLFVLASAGSTGPAAIAQERATQERPTQERTIRDIETRGFSNVTGLRRRGVNYVFQAEDLFGNKVRVVMNAETGEIVGLSRMMPEKK